MSGVKDLVAIPTAAFMKDPANVKQVGIGVGKGAVSFFSHSASGLFGFSARFLSQAGQAIAFFSLDKEYRQWHREKVVNEATNLDRVWKHRGMPTIQEIVVRPVADVVLGVTLGISGVVMSPYRGARKDGVRGFVVGTGVGVAGLVTKPIVGVFDSLTHGSQSIHDVAKTANFLQRRYQPVLKQRLPHVFGPMNILTPFDAVSSRSAYLLDLFPPKFKMDRESDKARELHVHSEVLNMEPGVETYAIVTNIRVILIKLDVTSSLAPTFGWEVEMSSDATISSQISDHGHNGVALTITKAVNLLPPPSGKLSKKMSDMTVRTRKTSMGSFSASAHSIQSAHKSEGEDDDEEVDDLGENFQSDRINSNPTTSKPLSESLTAGVTKKGNKTFEWFTVLAEYQQRKPLTRLHNAISCIVGDHDAIISDRPHAMAIPIVDEITSFGIYNFERGLPDGKAAKISNTKVIASLENLYWLESNVVQRLDKISSPDKRQRALNKFRDNWTFSNDMKASESIGGPDWLVVARARAMCIQNGSKEFQDEVSISSNQRQEGMRLFPEEFHGTRKYQNYDSGGQSARNQNHPSLDLQYHPLAPEHRLTNSPSLSRGVTSSVTTAPIPEQVETEHTRQTFHQSSNAGQSDDSREIELDFYSPINGTFKDSRIESFHDEDHRPPVPSLYVPASANSGQDNPCRDASSTSTSVSKHSKAVPAAASSIQSTRIDRLEGVMEQLLILNANQARQGATTSAVQSASPMRHVENLAVTLKNELIEIREKMNERAREDDALRQEIGILRHQLVEKRIANPESTTHPDSKNRKLPSIKILKPKTLREMLTNRKKKNSKRNLRQSVSDGSSNIIESTSLPADRSGLSSDLVSSSHDNINMSLGTGFDDERSESQSLL